MFHYTRRESKDFDGHGARVQALQIKKVGHGAEGSFDRYNKARRRSSRRCCCCRSGSGIKVKPAQDAALGSSDHDGGNIYAEGSFENPWGAQTGFREQQQQLAAQREAKPHDALEKLHTRLHQNPEDLGTSMDGVSAATFFKARPGEHAPTRRRHSILRGMAQAKANTRVMARRVSGVFARSKRADARREAATRAGRW